MKIILFLLAVLPFFVACSSNDEEKKSYAQQQSELQEEMYDKIKNNIVGHWKEYKYLGYTGQWQLSSEKDDSNIEYYTFYSDGTCHYRDIIEYTGNYIIKKNPNYIDENIIASGPYCCIIIEIDNGVSNDSYSVLLADDGTLKIERVFDSLGDNVFREPKYNKIFKKE